MNHYVQLMGDAITSKNLQTLGKLLVDAISDICCDKKSLAIKRGDKPFLRPAQPWDVSQWTLKWWWMKILLFQPAGG